MAVARREVHGRVRRGEVARLLPVAAVAAALAWTFVLLTIPDHADVSRAGTTTVVAAPSPAAIARLGPATQFGSRRLKLPQAQVTIASRAGVLRVPHSFFGLSTEYWALPLYGRHISLFERVLTLVQARGAGPLVLRIGGDSADHTFWDPKLRRAPPWVFKLTPAWLRQTSTIVHRVRARLILDLNLVTGSPSMAATWARAAETGLPHRSIVGFEVGNEPDIYSRPFWRAITSREMLHSRVLPSDISANSYTQAFQSYAHVLAQVAPSLPLAGPALADPGVNSSWISHLLGSAHPGLGMVSAHRYPYSACVGPSSASFPTIARLLSENASKGMAQTVSASVRLAHRAGLPFRMTELNSVTCGGRAGVSDSFATALWAPDALFELLRAGVDAVNLHIRANPINAPFTLSGYGLRARPLLYGLILFARTLGPDPQLIHVQLRAKRSRHLKVWAVRVRGDALHVLLINKSDHPSRVDLQLPAKGRATVQRLLAPAISSRSGVTLDGQQLGRDGSWQGHSARQTITPDVHGYQLTIPPFSAALVRARLRPGALVLNSGLGHG